MHFMYDGTLTTVVIERADSLASCADMVDPANQPDGKPGGTCEVVDGVLLLASARTKADQVTAQGVSAWVHGYVVTAISYNAAEGKDVAPVTAAARRSRSTTSRCWSPATSGSARSGDAAPGGWRRQRLTRPSGTRPLRWSAGAA